MRYIKSLFLFFVTTTISLSLFAQDEKAQDIQLVKNMFDRALTKTESYFLLQELCLEIGPRLSGSPGAAKAVEWAKAKMTNYDFDTVYFQEVQVPHWVRGDSEEVEIAGGQKLAALAIGGSVGTSKGGILAEVVEVLSMDDMDIMGDRLKGKLVFLNEPFDHRVIGTGAGYGGVVGQRVRGASRAAKHGALGVLVRSASSSFDDIPHTGTLAYSDEVPKIPAVCLGILSSDKLHGELLKNPTLNIRMTLNCESLGEAPSHNVIGEIRGSEHPEKIIVVGGHLDSWDIGHGAHDDGSGCVQSIGVLRLFKELGIQPKNTIRAVMFMNEENGLRGGKKYSKLAQTNKEDHIVAIESDAGGFTPRGFGISGVDEDVLGKMRGWLNVYDKRTISFIDNGGGGADIGPLHRETGTPMVGFVPDTQRLFDVHHSANDVFESVNRRELEMGTASIAALVYMIDKYGL